MPIELTGRVIFLATPGDLVQERAWVRDEVSVFNHDTFERTGIVYLVSGYEDGHGTVKRPQSAINPRVERSDFLMLIVGHQLGSATTASPPFRTGIEEELDVALACLENRAAPMEDVMMAFASVTESQLRQPHAALQEVLDFKHAVEATKELLYVQPYSDEGQLRRRVRVQLEAWAQLRGPKEARSCPRLRAALDGTERATMTQPSGQDPNTLIQWAEEQADRGLNTQADAAFALAILADDPDYLLRYAKFLQRTGQLERALDLDQRALERLAGPTSDESVGADRRASVLSHMGLLKRKLGDGEGALRLLDEAVATLRPHSADGGPTLTYLLDQIGITAARLGDLDRAERAYAESRAIREAAGDAHAVAQSLVNLARIARDREGDAAGVELLEEALRLLEPDEGRLAANALGALGDAVTSVDPGRANELLTKSLAINERLGNLDGVSVASNGLAELALAAGDTERARDHASRVFEVANETGNAQGSAVAYRLVGEIDLASGEPDGARRSFATATTLAIEQRNPGMEARARLGLARALFATGQSDDAGVHVEAGRAAAARASLPEIAAAFDELT